MSRVGLLKICAFILLLTVTITTNSDGSTNELSEDARKFFEQLSEESKAIFKLEDATKREAFLRLWKREKKNMDTIKVKENALKDREDTLNRVCRQLPHADFICALTFFKEDNKYYFMTLGGIKFLKIGREIGRQNQWSCPRWPSRVQEVREKNDLSWPDSGNPIPIYKTRKHRTELEDDKAFCKWTKFVTEDPNLLQFDIPSANEEEIKQKTKAYRYHSRQLQNILKTYYKEISDEEKRKYAHDEKCFLIHFAAITTRNYRYGCELYHRMSHILNNYGTYRYPNGTKYFFSTAFYNATPTWYFDMEFMDMSKLLLQAMDSDGKSFYISANITNDYGELVIVPGLRGCSEEPVKYTMYEHFFIEDTTEAQP